MDRVRALLREPALLIDLGETLVVFLVAFGIGGLTGDDQTYLVAAVIAVVGVLKGFTTKPFPVTVLTDATRALLVCAAAVWGVGLSADQIAVAATLVGTLFTAIARAQITPRKDPVQAPAGAGSGPVAEPRGEGGAADVSTVGFVVIVLGLLLLLLSALGVIALNIWVSVVVILVGVLILVLGPRHRV